MDFTRLFVYMVSLPVIQTGRVHSKNLPFPFNLVHKIKGTGKVKDRSKGSLASPRVSLWSRLAGCRQRFRCVECDWSVADCSMVNGEYYKHNDDCQQAMRNDFMSKSVPANRRQLVGCLLSADRGQLDTHLFRSHSQKPILFTSCFTQVQTPVNSDNKTLLVKD